jgi:tetratricopeptide (TPR) repeat protein
MASFMENVASLLHAGWHYRRMGVPVLAEQAYRRAVQLDEQSADAWAALGTLCVQRGAVDEAIEYFRRSLERRPGDANVHSNLGIALAGRGRVGEAIASFTQALEVNPLHADARANLGNALRELGRLEEAVTCFRAALLLQPNHAAAELNLGLALVGLSQYEEAAGHLRHATQMAPHNAQAHHALGLALAKQGELKEAVNWFERACRLQPDLYEAHHDLGMALGLLNEPAGALAALREAARLQPPGFELQLAMGIALVEMGDHSAALLPLQEALRLRPDSVRALVYQAHCLRMCGHAAEALAVLRRVAQLQPDDVDGRHELAVTYADLGRHAEAEAEFDATLRLRPEFPRCRWNRALVRLAAGAWTEGWRENEWRFRCGAQQERRCPQPRWDGSPLDGKTVLLWAEQGNGDIIQFVRYAALVKERGGRVLLDCPARLHPLLSSCPGLDRLLTGAVEDFDVHVPLMSLPGIFGTRVDSVPARVPYLFADPVATARWHRDLADVTGCRIGVCWQGNPKFPMDRLRSFPLHQLAPVAHVPGVRLVSLQTGPGARQLAEVRETFAVVDLGERLLETPGAFVDAAAVIKNLDLVISCDTAIAHLAGALGVPVWLALPYTPDWRWLRQRADTPWYPTMRLFRQSAPRHWESVFAAMARVLYEAGPTE